MLISHIIPAFNASSTVRQTLESVFLDTLPADWKVEAIVVDDGSTDGGVLSEIVAQFECAQLVVHPENKGMCAARNSGIELSKGDIVTILDSDDELIKGWSLVLASIIKVWPPDTNICYAACKNLSGQVTAEDPNYNGYLTLNDLLNERYSGEYIPLFRGDYVRSKPYIDLGIRKSCGIVSYMNWARDAPFWVENKVLRIYNDTHIGSISRDWTSPQKAFETALCYKALFNKFGDLYIDEAFNAFRIKNLKLAVYLKLSGAGGAFGAFLDGVSTSHIKESFMTFLLLILPVSLTCTIIKFIKSHGYIRRYG